MDTDRLIAQLAAEAAPVRRLASPGRRFAAWATVATAVVGIAAWMAWQGGFPAHLAHPDPLIQLAFAIVGAAAAGLAALWAAVPGLERRGRLYRIAFGIALLMPLPLIARIALDALRTGSGASDAGRVLHCSSWVAILGTIPGLLLFLLVARALPLDRPRTGLLALLAWGMTGAATILFLCGDTGALHLLVAHWGAVAALGLVGLGLGLIARAMPGSLGRTPAKRSGRG